MRGRKLLNLFKNSREKILRKSIRKRKRCEKELNKDRKMFRARA